MGERAQESALKGGQRERWPSILEADSDLAAQVRPLVDSATVLKAGVVEELGTYRRELEALRRQARETLSKAQEEAQAIRDEAHEEGRREGLLQWEEELAMARAEFGKLRRRGEREMVELAFELARRVLGRSLEDNPDWVADVVAQALPRARGYGAVEIRVHPEDRQWVEARRDAYARHLKGVPIYFCEDSAIDRGGCVVDTESGRIDACLDTQLAVLKEQVMREEP